MCCDDSEIRREYSVTGSHTGQLMEQAEDAKRQLEAASNRHRNDFTQLRREHAAELLKYKNEVVTLNQKNNDLQDKVRTLELKVDHKGQTVPSTQEKTRKKGKNARHDYLEHLRQTDTYLYEEERNRMIESGDIV